MKIRIPFSKKYLVISTEPTLDGKLIEIMKKVLIDECGNKRLDRISAIKYMRSISDISLHEAKEYVDNLAKGIVIE